MAIFHFELVSPEKLVFSGDVDQVDIPGSEGDFGVFAGHAPVVVILRPGILTVHTGGSAQRIVVFGGFAESSPAGLTVLADVATSIEDMHRSMLAEHIKTMEERMARMEQGSDLDREIERLDHFRAIDQHLTGTAMH